MLDFWAAFFGSHLWYLKDALQYTFHHSPDLTPLISLALENQQESCHLTLFTAKTFTFFHSFWKDLKPPSSLRTVKLTSPKNRHYYLLMFLPYGQQGFTFGVSAFLPTSRISFTYKALRPWKTSSPMSATALLNQNCGRCTYYVTQGSSYILNLSY